MKTFELLKMAKKRKLKNIGKNPSRRYLLIRLAPFKIQEVNPIHERIAKRAYIRNMGLSEYLFRYGSQMNCYSDKTARQAFQNNCIINL